ncbi:hypothetical protein [Acinetobacter soli]|nr:hypothetical protein [Acinetobacter soli]MEB4800680.1 hypothetical protein [Acinetobacter soli]
MSKNIEKIDLTDFRDHAEISRDQIKKLWALFSQIQFNLKQEKVHPSTLQLAEIGNFLTDMWVSDTTELYEQITNQLEETPNE